MSPDFFRDSGGTHSADTVHDTGVKNTSENVEDVANSEHNDNEDESYPSMSDSADVDETKKRPTDDNNADDSQQVPIHVNNDESQEVAVDNIQADPSSHEQQYMPDDTPDVKGHDDPDSYAEYDGHLTTHENAGNNHAQPDGSPMTTVSRDDADADDGYFHGDDGILYRHSEM